MNISVKSWLLSTLFIAGESSYPISYQNQWVKEEKTVYGAFNAAERKRGRLCLAWAARSDTTVFWAANTLPNQRYCSYSRDILKLLQRNFCGPAHKSDFSCERKTLEGRSALWRAAQCSTAPDKLLWKHEGFTSTSDLFGLRCFIGLSLTGNHMFCLCSWKYYWFLFH